MGWLLCVLGRSLIVDGVADGYAAYGAVARPGALPAARLVAVYSSSDVLVARVCIAFVLLLTPTGSLPSPRWRWWAWVTGLAGPLFLVVRWLLPVPLNPPYQQVTNPLAVQGLAGPLQVARAATSILTVLAVVVAAASLAVAAVFQPLRRRGQRAVDRRFNRRRSDAGRTIESFGARLHQRVDLDGLTAELLAVVDQTMQPTRASLWLRDSGRAG